MTKPFYITTTLPYVNGLPHIGFALEVVQADVIARYQTLLGNEVVFNIGTDEHGVKIYEEAEKRGMTPQAFCDEMSEHFRSLKSLLDISYTDFIRTTDAHHTLAAQEFWRRCLANGDIYKKQYQMKYCVGCELEKTDSELVDGKCADHPNREIEIVEEENYFFRFSKFQDALLALYGKDDSFVVPEKRLNEIREFVNRGPQDFSISRLAKKMPWGIPVPDDAEHVMYVWFDALVNYISTLGWPDHSSSSSETGGPDGEKFSRFWPGLQIAGKDNLRQQSAMWQAMLLSAGVAPSARILIHGHITNAGQKMSKSLGNVIAPSELVEKFGIDGARYILLSAAAFGEDIDITWERMSEKYNADLANGLGNLTSRLIKLSEKLDTANNEQRTENTDHGAGSREQGTFPEELKELMDEYRITEALEWIIGRTRTLDKRIAEVKPWELVKTDMPAFEKEMTGFLAELSFIASALSPFLPQTSEKIFRALQEGKTEPLFKRI